MTLGLIRSNYIYFFLINCCLMLQILTSNFIEEKKVRVKDLHFFSFSYTNRLIYGSVTKKFQNWCKAARRFQLCFRFIKLFYLLSTLLNVIIRICILLTASLENLHAIRTHTHLNAHTKTHIYTHITHSKQELLP